MYDTDDDDEEHEELVEWPGTDASMLAVVIHVSLLPLKFLLWSSVPDVRRRDRHGWYMTAIVSCVAWLAVLSFVMSISVEALAHAMDISDTVAGLTISAAGTSFPNVFASMIVARQGLGNMAVSNAMGSNVFNIFMGLGLPWLLYCFFPPSDAGNEVHMSTHVYHGLEAPEHYGVLFPTLLLLVLLLGFTGLLLLNNFRLHKRHAYLFIALYCGFLVWAFGWQCTSPELFSRYVQVNDAGSGSDTDDER
jgi:Ca2+/Na+ antiporter